MFLDYTLTFHPDFGLAIEAIEPFPTVVDKGDAFELEQVCIPVSEEVLWTLPIWQTCSRFTHGSSCIECMRKETVSYQIKYRGPVASYCELHNKFTFLYRAMSMHGGS